MLGVGRHSPAFAGRQEQAGVSPVGGSFAVTRVLVTFALSKVTKNKAYPFCFVFIKIQIER